MRDIGTVEGLVLYSYGSREVGLDLLLLFLGMDIGIWWMSALKV